MGKRKRDKERDEDYINKKIQKLQKKLRDKLPPQPLQQQLHQPLLSQHQSQPPQPPQPSSQPPHPPSPSHSSQSYESPHQMTPNDNDLEPFAESMDDELPEEFLIALGTEGEEQTAVREPIRTELASRWKKIMNDGLGKEAKEGILKKYPTPSNFPAAVAPVINPEIHATLSEPSVKRDKRFAIRQNLTGTLMSCLGKSLTSIMKGYINTKTLIEEINDAAKLAAEIHHQDSASRKFFCLAGANKTIQDAVRQQKTDKFLFGEDCAEKIKAAQIIQKTCHTIKYSTEKDKKQSKQPATNKFRQLNWKGPPQYDQQNHRARGGQQYRQPRKHYNQPHRKDKQNTYRYKSKYHR